MSTAVTKMTAAERAEYRAKLEAKSNPTDRDLRHLARLDKLEGKADAPAIPKPRPERPLAPAPVVPPAAERPRAPMYEPRTLKTPLPLDGMYRYVRSIPTSGGRSSIPWMLMASYSGLMGSQLLSDNQLQVIAADIKSRLPSLSGEKYFSLIDPDTGKPKSDIPPEDYPGSIRAGARHLMSDTEQPIGG